MIGRLFSDSSPFITWIKSIRSKKNLFHAAIWFSLHITFIKARSIPIQNNMHCWRIEIKQNLKYKPFDNFGDFSKITFFYHSNDIKRNPWVVLFIHCPINDSCGCLQLLFTLQLCYRPLGILQRVIKSQKVHISSHVLQKLHNIDFVRHNSQGFLIESVEK